MTQDLFTKEPGTFSNTVNNYSMQSTKQLKTARIHC